MTHRLSSIHYNDLIRRELAADLGDAGDLTTNSIVPGDHDSEAALVAREPGIVCGLGVAADVFAALDDQVTFEAACTDGDEVRTGDVLARIRGRTRALLAAERTALNLLCHLSGVATTTQKLAELISDLPAKVVDTRKTLPGLRALQKYAVRVGGGANHRFGLYDAVLIKDNHRAVAGGVAESIRLARRQLGHTVHLEVEVDSLDELAEALDIGVDAVLLDNFSTDELRRAVAMIDGRAITEASGNISAETIRQVAETCVDIISVGRLTHSAPSLDLALDIDVNVGHAQPQSQAELETRELDLNELISASQQS